MVEKAIAPKHGEIAMPEHIELTSFITPHPLFDDIMAEVASMAAPVLSWRRWRPAPKRLRWDPSGLVPTIGVAYSRQRSLIIFQSKS